MEKIVLAYPGGLDTSIARGAAGKVRMKPLKAQGLMQRPVGY